MKEGPFVPTRSVVLKKSLSLLAGAAVLAAAAVPAAGQSSGKIAPAKVTRKTKPIVGHHYPWKFTTAGAVIVVKNQCPPGTTDTTYCTPRPPKPCKGKVRVWFTIGKKVVSSKKATLKKNCKYKSAMVVRDKSLAGQRMRVHARFLGNSVLKAKSARGRRVLIAKHSTGL
jgi:hypothetical protein